MRSLLEVSEFNDDVIYLYSFYEEYVRKERYNFGLVLKFTIFVCAVYFANILYTWK